VSVVYFTDRDLGLQAPFIAKVYRASPAELTKNPSAAGRIELWIDA
jgi:hypothetical protein